MYVPLPGRQLYGYPFVCLVKDGKADIVTESPAAGTCPITGWTAAAPRRWVWRVPCAPCRRPRAALQVVTAAVLSEPASFRCHLRGAERVAAFRIQAVAVVLRVNPPYVRQEVIERSDAAIFREHGQSHFTQRVEHLKSRKHKSVVPEGVTYGVGRFM